MDNTINSDLIRGHINTIILKALYEGDRYGYDIIKDIEQKSSGQYILKQPTLYSCLKRLESQGFISSYWGAKSNGGRRKYYALTDMGRELFLKNQTDWEYSRTVIDRLISDKTFDFSTVPPTPQTGIPEFADATEAESHMTDEEIERAFNDDSDEEPDDDPAAVETVNDETPSEPDEATFAQDVQTENSEETEAIPIPPESETTSGESDTASILHALFEEKVHENADASYAEKLNNSAYTPTVRPRANDYFTDFPVEDEESETPFDTVAATTATAQVIEEPPAQAPAKRIADILGDDPPKHYTPFFYNTSAPAEETHAQAESETTENDPFIRYDAQVTETSSDRDTVLIREYRNILGDMLAQTRSEAEPSTETETAEDQVTEENTPTETPPAQSKPRGLEKLESEIKDLGDGITIRTHNSQAAKEYVADNYYYSNKLMLYHYGFLFGITVLEIVFLFLFIRIGLNIKQVVGNFQVDLLLYGLAIGGALVFPIVAAILNFRNPDKRKRVNFTLKSSLVFRILLTVTCMILVYLINLRCGMPLTSVSGYVPSLFIPLVLCLNFVFSTLIFYGLYNSGKFNVNA